MITFEQLLFVLGCAYPNFVHGKDYGIGFSVDPKNPTVQNGDAHITFWSSTEVEQPDANVVTGLVAVHGDKFNAAQQASATRVQRNKLLCEADALINAAHIANKQKDSEYILAMRKYRQALRDVPSQANFPASVTWPTLPEQA